MGEVRREPTPTPTGHFGVAVDYLDAHYEAARPEYEAMARSVGLRPGWRVLDAGAGSGSYLPLLAELVGPGGHLAALDHAPENVAAIRRHAARGDIALPVDAYVGSVTALPFPDGSFDAVWCANVLQYVDDAGAERALAEFRRVVRPGGLVAVKEQDGTAFLFGGTADPAPVWRLVEAARPLEAQFAHVLRAPALRRWLERLGLVAVWQRATLIERWAPLRSAERQFLLEVLPYFASVARRAGLPAADVAFWEGLADPAAPGSPLSQPDFYYREGHVVAVGRVPQRAGAR